MRRYEVSPVRQTQIYDKRSSDYRNDNIFDTFGLRQKTEETDNGLGEMIESSHKKREEGRVSVGTRIYGGPRVEVERVERMEPRV